MRIFIADDEYSVRSALRCLLEQQPGLRVVGEAVCWTDVKQNVRASHAGTLLLDWELPGLAAPDLARLPHKNLRIIVLSSRPEAKAPALAAGADAFVCKSDAPDRLLAALTWRAGQ